MKALWIVLLITAQSLLGADLCQEYRDRINFIQKADGSDRKLRIHDLLQPGQNAACFAAFVDQDLRERNPSLAQTFIAEITKFERNRLDKQAGASTGGGATTDLVSKGVVAKTLAVASDYGALTEAVNNQAITVSGSLDGIPSALVRQGVVYYCVPGISDQKCLHPELFDILRRFSYGVTFDASSDQTATAKLVTESSTGGTQPVTFAADRHQISSVTGRIALWNNRDLNSSDFQKSWQQQLQDSRFKAAEQTALAKFKLLMDATTTDQLGLMTIAQTPGFYDWSNKAQTSLEQASNEALQGEWANQLKTLIRSLEAKNPDFLKASLDFAIAISQYSFEQNALLTLGDKPVFSLQYVDNRPAGELSHSTFRLVFDKGLGPSWSVTANLAADIYDGPPNTLGIRRLRDLQCGAEVDRKLGSLSILGAAALSWAYYFQDQKSSILMLNSSQPLPGISFVGLPSGANTVFAQTGNIHIAQMKLTLGASSSVRVPIAVTWSNRSELVPKSGWRAQVGISYDFDALFAK